MVHASASATIYVRFPNQKQKYSSATIIRPPQGRPSFSSAKLLNVHQSQQISACRVNNMVTGEPTVPIITEDNYFDFYYNSSVRNSEILFLGNIGNKQKDFINNKRRLQNAVF